MRYIIFKKREIQKSEKFQYVVVVVDKNHRSKVIRVYDEPEKAANHVKKLKDNYKEHLNVKVIKRPVTDGQDNSVKTAKYTSGWAEQA